MVDKEIPDADAEGWWARLFNGQLRWFYVHRGGRDIGFGDSLGIVSESGAFVVVTAFTCPGLTRWFGPVELP